VGVAFFTASGYCGNKRKGSEGKKTRATEGTAALWKPNGRMSNFAHHPITRDSPRQTPVIGTQRDRTPGRIALELPLQHGSQYPCTRAIGFYNKLITLYQQGMGVSFPHASNTFMDWTHASNCSAVLSTRKEEEEKTLHYEPLFG